MSKEIDTRSVDSEMQYPVWLTPNFIEEQLRNHYQNDQLKITSFDLMPGSEKGVGCLSSMHRIDVCFKIDSQSDSSMNDQDKRLNLMIKEAPSNEVPFKVGLQCDVYNREIDFYAELAPRFNQKLSDLGDSQLIPEIFGLCKNKRMMIMEDLAAKRYDFVPVERGFNLAEAKVILKRLAVFHAIGAVLLEREPDIFAKYRIGRFSREMVALDDSNIGNFDAVLDAISKWPDFSVYTDKFRRIQSEFVERYRRTYDFNPNNFNTLIHDDVYCPNLMIRSTNPSAETPIDNVVLIDFQFVHWTSPTIDLHCFFSTSLSDDIVPQCFNKLIEYYYGHLVETFEKLKFKNAIPSCADIKAQYQDRKFIGFVMSCLFKPMAGYRAQISVEHLTQLNDETMKYKEKVFQHENVQAILRKLIPYYDKMGTFD